MTLHGLFVASDIEKPEILNALLAEAA